MAEHSGKDILSSDVEIKGSIKFQKELLIDGKVEGEINSDGVLTIGENADIRGEIKTKSITVYGKVQGNITVGERCELKSRCTLQGDLKAARLVIEEGATFIGKSEVTSGTVAQSRARAQAGDRAERRAGDAGQDGFRRARLSRQPFAVRDPWPSRRLLKSVWSVHTVALSRWNMPRRRARCAANAARILCRRRRSRSCGFAPEKSRRSRPRRDRRHRFFENSKVFGASSTLARSNVLIARRSRKSVPPRPRRFARSAARTSICAITRSPRASAASIRTHGEVHLTAKGDLSSSSVICRSALIEGKDARQSALSRRRATINFSGKIPGRLTAEHVMVERKSDVQFFRRVRVEDIEIRGRMTGEIVAEGSGRDSQNALLDGNVTREIDLGGKGRNVFRSADYRQEPG